MTAAERLDRRARRITDRERAALPLLAALIPETTAAHLVDRKAQACAMWAGTKAGLDQLHHRHAEQAARDRAAVADLGGDLRQLDARRALLPDSPTYSADFWRSTLAQSPQYSDLWGCDLERGDDDPFGPADAEESYVRMVRANDAAQARTDTAWVRRALR